MTALPSAPPEARTYHTPSVRCPVPITAKWDDAPWRDVEPAPIDQYHHNSYTRRPDAAVKMVYSEAALHLLFQVHDRYTVSRHMQRQSAVSRDSCVEFFVLPGADLNHGYLNFELNAGGTLLAHHSHVEDGQMRCLRQVSDAWMDRIGLHTPMPRRIDAEWEGPWTWSLGLSIPIALFEVYFGALGDATPAPGVRWRANWYKCSSACSHPHWATWSDIAEDCNFHQPDRFGTIVFE